MTEDFNTDKPDRYTQMTLSSDDLEDMKQHLQEWEKDPSGKSFLDWLRVEMRVGILTMSKIMRNPKGRSGPYHAISAMKEIVSATEAMTRFLDATREEEHGKQRSEEENSGLDSSLADGPPGDGASVDGPEPAGGTSEDAGEGTSAA